MFCPLKHLFPTQSPTDRCDSNCAWAIHENGLYACAFAVIAAKNEGLDVSYNVGTFKGSHERP